MTSRRSFADGAYERLRSAIVGQRLEPGTPLVETEIAEALGISRTPVRQALTRLELEGLVTRRDNGRPAVSKLSGQDVEGLFATRIQLEGYAARLAAERISDTELSVLRALVAADEEVLVRDDIPGLAAINTRIHGTIIDASRNRVLIQLLGSLNQRLVGLSAFAVGEARQRHLFVSDHADLVELLADGNGAGAEHLVVSHLERARDLLLRSLQTRVDVIDDSSPLARLLSARPAEAGHEDADADAGS